MARGEKIDLKINNWQFFCAIFFPLLKLISYVIIIRIQWTIKRSWVDDYRSLLLIIKYEFELFFCVCDRHPKA
jgi:hypothetical protein